MRDHVLLTGATGLVGQYLVRDLLLRDVPLAVVIRGQEHAPAAARLDAILEHWQGELGRSLPRPVCLEGEITQPHLGLSPEALRWVAERCSSVLHNAASLKFQGHDRSQEPWLSNYTGTSNVLDLCRRTGIGALHYVSTAYVCGQRKGVVRETELDLGQTFRNDYEECKCAAEKLVTAAPDLDRTIYRPAVIVGDSRTGFTITYHALYSYFQFVQLFCQTQERGPDGYVTLDLRLNLTGQEPRNLIPVDWVSAVLTHLFLTPATHGRTYHLTPPDPVTARGIVDPTIAHFRVKGVRYVGAAPLPESAMNAVERLFYNYVAQYQAYWHDEPRFDCTATRAAAPHLPCPPIDEACIHRLIDFALADNWGKKKRRKKRAKSD